MTAGKKLGKSLEPKKYDPLWYHCSGSGKRSRKIKIKGQIKTANTFHRNVRHLQNKDKEKDESQTRQIPYIKLI